MKKAVNFILIYSIVSALMLILWQIVLHPLGAEIFSYAIWLYVFYAVVGIVVFLLFGLFSDRYRLSFRVRLICYAILCLFVLNSIPLLGEKKFLTFDVIKSLFSQNYEPIDIGIHIIAIVSFCISFVVVFRKTKLGTSRIS